MVRPVKSYETITFNNLLFPYTSSHLGAWLSALPNSFCQEIVKPSGVEGYKLRQGSIGLYASAGNRTSAEEKMQCY